MFFRLPEYAAAEKEFLGRALHELADSRGGILSLVSKEPTSRTGTTRVTVDSGEIVEFEPTEVAARITLEKPDLVATRVEGFIVAIDDAAGQYYETVERSIFENLERLTEATGLQVDASGKDINDAIYEALESMEISFEEDGSVSKSFRIVASPEAAERLSRAEAEMTDEQRRRLDELMDRKRKEFFARRRGRTLS